MLQVINDLLSRVHSIEAHRTEYKKIIALWKAKNNELAGKWDKKHAALESRDLALASLTKLEILEEELAS